MMISPIPYRHLSLTTPLTGDDILARLRQNTVEGSPYRRFMRDVPDQPFRGEIEGSTFRITRLVQFNNTSIPLVVGTIRDQGDTRRIALTIRPGGAGWLQSIVVLAFPIFLGTNAVLLARDGQPPDIIMRLVVLAVVTFLLAYVPSILFFNREARRAVERLRDILDTIAD